MQKICKASDRKCWENLDVSLKERYIQMAEELNGYAYPSLLATDYMAYARNGNRKSFENAYFSRRKALTNLIIGECIAYKGRFLDSIINGIWLICEETTWVLPAHSERIDLFSAETGALLSYAYFLLGDELNTIAPLVAKRMKSEVQNRILTPYRNEEIWWMGFGDKKPMNWTTWCSVNCLSAFLIMEENIDVQTCAIDKITRSLEQFIASYGDDGGCDEGISYWERAGGCLFEAYEILSNMGKDMTAAFSDQKLHNIFDFPYKVNIDADNYVNFADASTKNAINVSLLYRIGERINNDALIQFSQYLYHVSKKSTFKRVEMTGINLYRQVMDLLVENEFVRIDTNVDIERKRDVYFDSIEVAVARQNHSGNGLYLAAKGGNNFENHNHNDVGSFIVYKDCNPIFIDVGVEIYTKKTFSDRRYEIWTMQSQYHNLPTMAGAMQKDGKIYQATNVVYNCTDKRLTFSMNIENAYGDSNVQSLRRSFTFHRNDEPFIEITDEYILQEHTKDTHYYFMCLHKPCLMAEGTIEIQSNGTTAHLLYDKARFRFGYEEIEVNDSRLTPVWGTKMYRVVLTLLQKELLGKVTFKIC